MDKNIDFITNMEDDFAKWYTDIVKKADLVDYSSIRGCMILKPHGYAIWENIQNILDTKFKMSGHQNVYMPMFIPEDLLQKEKEHVEGFSPEVAWVTHGGDEKLEKRLVVRPTSEALFCEHYSNSIESYRDLPKLYNQWCSVVRWEKTTRPFLRSLEFLWQEGHTAHQTQQEAQEETLKMLDIYEDFCQNYLAIPVIKGKKTDKEKFAGAVSTYTIESLMHDGKSLQTATSHNFGDKFAKAFDITFTDQNNKRSYVYQTSWGASTRLIGAIIMVHADSNGLILPPKIAPTQVAIVPIASQNQIVIEKSTEIFNKLNSKLKVILDNSKKSPGWKFSQHEMQGVPLRIELGPKDIEKNQCILVRRDTREKIISSFDDLEKNVFELLENIQNNLFNIAQKKLQDKTFVALSKSDFYDIAQNKSGFIKGMWCGSTQCEEIIKEELNITSRCIPFENTKISDKCICCQEDANTLVFWGKSY